DTTLRDNKDSYAVIFSHHTSKTMDNQGRGAVSICGFAAWARPAPTHPQTKNDYASPPAAPGSAEATSSN
ncbi:hypothetical protein, partial [Streptomyces prunicolor]|uniref:hypothetical protein n=1 Tax=Streptomyces prunicolor TaxID=67348 RepID=UPI0033F917F4